ncbi:hypothetical protein [Cytobacillus sp. Bac17]|uniref:hypothetical protein n=1 Tax=Cytobacillus sp. Bac17 TaxID=2926008 RepID=UPI0021187A22|nr:hypothetical protein [Cytobacillus sp. Bac17]
MLNQQAISNRISNTEKTARTFSLDKLQRQFLINQIKPLKIINVPTLKYSIESDELVEWIFEKLSNDDIQKISSMLRIAQKRSADIRPLIGTIALSLLKK